MADLSITISNKINTYSPGETSRWGEMVWGTNVWGSDRDTDFVIGKGIKETLTLTDTGTDFDIEHKTGAETLNLDSAVYKMLSHMNTDFGNIDFGSEVTSLILASGSWSYKFKGVADLDDRVCPEYTEVSGSSPTYTPVTGSDPDWS